MYWKELTVQEQEAAWSTFSERFAFKPSVHAYNFPGIKEPAPSVTYSLREFYRSDLDLSSRLEEDLTLKASNAFRMIAAPGEFLLALDWQHDCFSFDPHARETGEIDHVWSVPILPRGDYSIFVTKDFTNGIFGHPWEQTICVFGQSLLSAFDEFCPLLFGEALRIDGKNVKEFDLDSPPEGSVLKVFISTPGEGSDEVISKILKDLKRAFYEKNHLNAFHRVVWAGNGYVIYIGDKIESTETTKNIAWKILHATKLPGGSDITEIKNDARKNGYEN